MGAKKAALGKLPTDVWWHTIVSPTGKEKTGYATQKPLGILERIVRVHSNPGERVVDFFAGSGTTGEAAAMHGREFLLVDESEEAVAVMTKRLARYQPALSRVKSDTRLPRNRLRVKARIGVDAIPPCPAGACRPYRQRAGLACAHTWTQDSRLPAR